jgi:type II secretory pathway pseudopilin PulG
MMAKRTNPACRAFTLLELVLVMALVVGMLGFAFLGYSGWAIYRDSTKVEAGLNLIASGQRNYLLANPDNSYSDITEAILTTWIPTGVIPTFPAGTSALKYDAFPPSAQFGGKTWTAKEF